MEEFKLYVTSDNFAILVAPISTLTVIGHTPNIKIYGEELSKLWGCAPDVEDIFLPTKDLEDIKSILMADTDVRFRFLKIEDYDSEIDALVTEVLLLNTIVQAFYNDIPEQRKLEVYS